MEAKAGMPEPLAAQNDLVFVDTNLFGYAADRSEPEKRERALHVIGAHGPQIVVSMQVLIELFNVIVRKVKAPPQRAAQMVRFVSQFKVVAADRELIAAASAVALDQSLSIFDAAILAAAERAGCSVLLSEDAALLAASSPIKIVDPFAADAD